MTNEPVSLLAALTTLSQRAKGGSTQPRKLPEGGAAVVLMEKQNLVPRATHGTGGYPPYPVVRTHAVEIEEALRRQRDQLARTTDRPRLQLVEDPGAADDAAISDV